VNGIKKTEVNMSRADILAAVKQNQPTGSALPDLSRLKQFDHYNTVEQFCETARNIGSKVFVVKDLNEVKQHIVSLFSAESKKITMLPELSEIADATEFLKVTDPHRFQDIDLAVLSAELGVAENSGLWLAESAMGHRVIPFICQHLALVVPLKAIIPTMMEAYELIGTSAYGYGVFIAGPSKTADIEQSLVLGAHGPRSLAIFLLEE
jgi:L-lactate dehydrogenase complex protein LldG